MSRRIVFLGTSSQVPTRERSHHSCFVRWDGSGVLFDPGEGTQRQMVLAGLRSSQITDICITHFHGDHCLGLPGVLQRRSLDGITAPLHLWFPEEGARYVERLRQASIFDDRTAVVLHPVDGTGPATRSGALTITARTLRHGVPTVGWRIGDPPGRTLQPDRLEAAGVRGPVIGRLVRDGRVAIGDRRVTLDEVSQPRAGCSLAFVMDTGPCPGASALAAGVDVLVCEATFAAAQADVAARAGHMTADGAATLAATSGAGALLLTHFSPRYPSTEALLAEARAVFPDAVAATDLLELPLDRPSRQLG